MKFELKATDLQSKARAGIINTDHGIIETPIFMPVGTSATIKGVHQRDVKNEINPDVILANTYHLYLRPGENIIEKAGGIHKFMNWDRNILTDSGGYQVYSLSNNRKINEEGVEFKSHIDGSYHFFTPERAINIQKSIGADIIMAFDECTPYPCEFNYAKKSMHMTHRWLKRCVKEFNKSPSLYEYTQTLFPIVQGSTYKDLRAESAEFISSIGAKGNAIGGLSVGEPAEEMYGMTEIVCNILPEDKPRYLMGVGTPINLLENIALGVDMFDCVMPSRNARNGMLFTADGTINIKNKKWKEDFSVIDSNNYSFVDLSYSKAYLKHLFSTKEALGRQIATIHNLAFYLWLVKESRKQILKGKFSNWKSKMIKRMNNRL
ncbi:tRNA guanosine(34) transglycosylase Tgt [Flavobacteriaceae bacterium]|jgi:queuine tRNA-ribosyltransferase|nr:tRNA guanosine(34) transglycosylase Tgt [Flavobacteriaceae bacterium]|tara:strand:- start:2702 stop:3832 length:1131 start_codon:yes stop_codon:yes gene_type:complete